ncbi:hypothetical protein PI124_g20049 [Phytophthora idaei]|nr:hypothetical protein PI125_g21207 [Phytophthora idaei]KAG3234899.1 hypothetical protein PI124_g20049 [Phytophthora idaei]
MRTTRWLVKATVGWQQQAEVVTRRNFLRTAYNGMTCAHKILKFSSLRYRWSHHESHEDCGGWQDKSVELQVSDTVQFQIHWERSNWSQRVGCREWQQQNRTART